MQLVDELSMIYTTCLMVHASFSYSRSRLFSIILGVGLLLLSGSITVRILLWALDSLDCRGSVLREIRFITKSPRILSFTRPRMLY